MAYVRGPLLSLEARGSIAKAITFQFDGKGYQCRKIPIPRYQRTTEQANQRNTHKASVKAWQELLDSQKDLWRAYSDNNGNKGYYAFMSQWIHRAVIGAFQYKLPPNLGYCIVGEVTTGEFLTGGEWMDPSLWL